MKYGEKLKDKLQIPENKKEEKIEKKNVENLEKENNLENLDHPSKTLG